MLCRIDVLMLIGQTMTVDTELSHGFYLYVNFSYQPQL